MAFFFTVACFAVEAERVGVIRAILNAISINPLCKDLCYNGIAVLDYMICTNGKKKRGGGEEDVHEAVNYKLGVDGLIHNFLDFMPI